MSKHIENKFSIFKCFYRKPLSHSFLINYLRRRAGVVVQMQGGGSVFVGAVDQVSDRVRSLQDRSGNRIRVWTERIDDDLFRSFDFGATKWTATSTLGILSLLIGNNLMIKE
jgi:hypothetical protein